MILSTVFATQRPFDAEKLVQRLTSPGGWKRQTFQYVSELDEFVWDRADGGVSGRVSRSTMSRTLSQLVDAGSIRTTAAADGRVLYERDSLS